MKRYRRSFFTSAALLGAAITKGLTIAIDQVNAAGGLRAREWSHRRAGLCGE